MTARESIAVLLGALDEALLDLEQYAREVSRERLGTDRGAFRMVCHALYVASQAAIDLGEVLVSARGLGPAGSYREVFDLLARAGVLTPALASRLGAWAGLRNVLAHFYTKLDLDRLHAAYTGDLEPLRELRRVAVAAA